MIICSNIEQIRKYVSEKRAECKNIGFVPTMGYLHQGHLSLLKESAKNNEITIMSIYVNPTQFGPDEDLDKYPRNLERDIQLAENSGADALFTPSDKELYPHGYKTYVYVKNLDKNLCGEKRPGHFQGVTTIVSKLFNIVQPDTAYFGQKDAQQAAIIEKMTEDLNFNIKIKVCPIIRESDGLAMSSRNVYLTEEQRKNAVILYESLILAKKIVIEGEKSVKIIIDKITENINSINGAVIDYVEIVNYDDLEKTTTIKGRALIALAVYFGKTRLIDNIILEVQ